MQRNESEWWHSLHVKQIQKVTTYTRTQIDSIDCQVFSDPTQKMVQFDPVENWVIGDENTIRYMMPFELQDAGNDWVGVFKVSRMSCLTGQSSAG